MMSTYLLAHRDYILYIDDIILVVFDERIVIIVVVLVVRRNPGWNTNFNLKVS